jgi:hypothetical protein
MLCCRRQSARCVLNDLDVLSQGLELLVTVLLARNRQSPINISGRQRPTRRRRHRSEPLPTVTAGVPHAKFRLSFAAELVTLPSGLLAKVGEAIVKLEVLLGPTGLRTPEYSYCHPARRLHDGSLHIAGRTCLPHAARRKMPVPCARIAGGGSEMRKGPSPRPALRAALGLLWLVHMRHLWGR